MKYLTRSVVLPTLVLSFSVITFAQGFKVEGTSPSSQTSSKSADTFISMEARFSIALPKQISAYGPLSVETPQGRLAGDSYSWNTAEGKFRVGIFRLPESFDESARRRDFKVAYVKGLAAKVDELRGQIVSHNELSLAGHPGLELILEFPSGSLVQRTYFYSPHVYWVSATVKSKDHVEEAVRVLNTFKLLTTLEVETALRQKVKDAEPGPLPQEPIAQKLKSDLEDDGLLGKVKTIVTETSNQTEVNGKVVEDKRKPSSSEYYNDRGNLIRRESYDWKGNPRDITVYGYIDGDRASHAKYLTYEYDPPPMMMPPLPPGQLKPQYDSRYSNKFKFKYDAKGNLEEKQWYGNTGKMTLRYVYKMSGKQRERLVYSADGSLNQKYFSILDDKGNEIEMTDFDIKDDSIRSKYSYSYQFDHIGNWITRTTSKWVTKGENSYFEPSWVTYRTISYY